MTKRIIIVSLTLFLCFTLKNISLASNTASHTLTIKVVSFSEISGNNDNINLTANTSSPFEDSETIQRGKAGNLLWNSNQPDKKITVMTDMDSPDIALKAAAKNVRGAKGIHEVSLNHIASDFVTGMDAMSGHCDLEYSANMRSVPRMGIEKAFVTFTLTDL